MPVRPRVAILGRFTASASAIRYRGVLSVRELVELVCAGAHSEIYDVDILQDQADFDAAEAALAIGLPVLGACRGMHVLNVLAGLGVSGNISISCYHHQAIRELFAHVT